MAKHRHGIVHQLERVIHSFRRFDDGLFYLGAFSTQDVSGVNIIENVGNGFRQLVYVMAIPAVPVPFARARRLLGDWVNPKSVKLSSFTGRKFIGSVVHFSHRSLLNDGV